MEANSSAKEPARSQPTDDSVKSESQPAESPRVQTSFEATTPSSSSRFKSPSLPLPSTETNENATMAAPSATGGSKKKGTASVTKKAPKRAKASSSKKSSKKAKPDPAEPPPEEEGAEEEGSDDESDNGPYCICRGPDDHRWMICCEQCDDWFHGECINLDKDIGESLIEKFVCPNCTKGNLTTLYKKTCTLSGCKKPARLAAKERSVFCSNEHTNMWWERMIGRLPKSRSKAGQNDELTQEELMALLGKGYAKIDKEGNMKLSKLPFQEDIPSVPTEKDIPDHPKNKDREVSYFLSDEEKSYLESMASVRVHLAQDTILCHKMIALIELAQERRKAAIKAGRFGEDICGYDQRLDSVLARDAFAAFVKSPEGEAVYSESKLGDPQGEGDLTRGMCDRKRCKVHGGWAKMLTLGIKHQIREMAGQAAEVTEEERVMRAAAGERWQRKQAERNWVEAIED